MNILHMKYAVEVARLGSLSKAAEALHTAQPNISRSIKDLEADLGITIFHRSAKGMELTPDGEEFIGYAQSILGQIDEVDMLYKKGSSKTQRFSLSSPRASYISEALAIFSRTMDDGPVELIYQETNTQETINNVLNNNYKLGIIRYASHYDTYFKSMLEEKGLSYEVVSEFTYCLIFSEQSSLAGKDALVFSDLNGHVEIAHADSYVPSIPLAKVYKEELPYNADQRIFIFERASQFDLLSENQHAFMWVSPMPHRVLKRYGLVQRSCVENHKIYKDVLIYREGYRLSRMDKQFITALCDSRRRYFS